MLVEEHRHVGVGVGVMKNRPGNSLLKRKVCRFVGVVDVWYHMTISGKVPVLA